MSRCSSYIKETGKCNSPGGSCQYKKLSRYEDENLICESGGEAPSHSYDPGKEKIQNYQHTIGEEISNY